MDSLIQGTEVSPADFTLSVHHALAGLLSIATGNTEGHTAVSAGTESLFYALLEGAVCSASPVLIAHYDEPLPSPYDAFGHKEDETAALVLCLDQEGLALRLSWEPSAEGASPSQAPAGLLVKILAGTANCAVFVGKRLTWTIDRADAAA